MQEKKTKRVSLYVATVTPDQALQVLYLVRRVCSVPRVVEVDNNPGCESAVNRQQVLGQEIPLWRPCMNNIYYHQGSWVLHDMSGVCLSALDL